MASTTTKPDLDATSSFDGGSVSAWQDEASSGATQRDPATRSPQDALQALLAFSALHAQVKRRKAFAKQSAIFDAGAPAAEFDPDERWVLDEVLQLVAERAVAITGADGLAIALAENNEIVLRAAAGIVRPDVGARIERDSAFSGACFRSAQIVTCDDTETDPRVNVDACRKLGARSMIAVPLCGRRRVIGVLEAFFAWPFGFNDSDTRNLSLLAELILGALKPEDEDRFAESAQVAAKKLDSTPAAAPAPSASKNAPEVAPAATAPTSAENKPSETRVEPLVAATDPVSEKRALAEPAQKPAEIKNAPAAESGKAAEARPVADDKKLTDAKPASAGTEKKPDEKTPAPTSVSAAKSAVESPRPQAGALSAAQAPAITSAPIISTPGTQPGERRPLMPILLVGVVITAAFAAGVWWKLKTAQLGSAVIQVQKDSVPSNPVSAPSPDSSMPAAPLPGNPTSATANADLSDASAGVNSPATPQELSKFPRVTGVRHWTSADASTVVLDLQDQVQYEAHRITGPDRIYFDLRDTQLAPDLVAKSIEVGDAFVSRIRMAQPVAGMTRIVLDTRANSTFSVSLEPNPYRLVVEIRKIGSTPKAEVNLFPTAPEAAKSKTAIVIPPPTKEDLQLRARISKMRIVVDAGHGGWDLGTVGRRGLLEKDLVLEISQRLGKLLESRLGAEVIYTRQDDNYIPLDERANIANQSQADLFVSVHANYSDLPSARGVETYYTNFFTAPGSKEMAGQPDPKLSAIAGAAGSLVKNVAAPTLSPADLHERVEQSRRLAASVQRSLYGTLSASNPGLRDRGIKEAGFVVLTESAMPGILAEVSFVSSPTDEQKLRSDGYREQIAEALYRGIARYAASSKTVKMASAK